MLWPSPYLYYHRHSNQILWYIWETEPVSIFNCHKNLNKLYFNCLINLLDFLLIEFNKNLNNKLWSTLKRHRLINTGNVLCSLLFAIILILGLWQLHPVGVVYDSGKSYISYFINSCVLYLPV